MKQREVLTPQQAGTQYRELVQAFGQWLPEPGLRAVFAQEVDGYVRTWVLGTWQAEHASSINQVHVDFYNTIHTGANPSPSALYWEVATGVAGFQPPALPHFLKRLGEYDQTHGTGLARRFVDQLTLILLLYAGADQVVTDREAAFVNQSMDGLLAALGAENPVPPQSPVSGKADGENPTESSQTPQPSLEELMAQLDQLCGLERVKQDVKSLTNLVKVRRLRQQAGLPVPPMSLHLVFLGNPGTGKTTVARLLAGIYRAIGVLSQGQLVEVDRSGLVAGYVGQTALKTQEVIQKALGGVLFIDEAYALVNPDNGNDFGREAIEVLLKNMEDHREDLIVIVAGYSGPMEDFLHANPGLESRFNKYILFEDYTGEELASIFLSMCKKHGYRLSPAGEEEMRSQLMALYEHRDENFGNAREVRNRFEQAVVRQSDRVAQLDHPTREQLMELLPEDLGTPTEGVL